MTVLKEHAEAARDLVRAVDDLHTGLTREPRPAFGDRGYRSELVLPDWMAAALRLCRDGADGIASHFRPVPAEWLRPEDGVRCVCGKLQQVSPREFVECAGGCNRWFVRDDGGVWAARLPLDDS